MIARNAHAREANPVGEVQGGPCAYRAEGTRLFALAGRPTKAQFVKVYGPPEQPGSASHQHPGFARCSQVIFGPWWVLISAKPKTLG